MLAQGNYEEVDLNGLFIKLWLSSLYLHIWFRYLCLICIFTKLKKI